MIYRWKCRMAARKLGAVLIVWAMWIWGARDAEDAMDFARNYRPRDFRRLEYLNAMGWGDR